MTGRADTSEGSDEHSLGAPRRVFTTHSRSGRTVATCGDEDEDELLDELLDELDEPLDELDGPGRCELAQLLGDGCGRQHGEQLIS